eukprot:3145080-Pleurochrysis_carterae.AAC.1
MTTASCFESPKCSACPRAGGAVGGAASARRGCAPWQPFRDAASGERGARRLHPTDAGARECGLCGEVDKASATAWSGEMRERVQASAGATTAAIGNALGCVAELQAPMCFWFGYNLFARTRDMHTGSSVDYGGTRSYSPLYRHCFSLSRIPSPPSLLALRHTVADIRVHHVLRHSALHLLQALAFDGSDCLFCPRLVSCEQEQQLSALRESADSLMAAAEAQGANRQAEPRGSATGELDEAQAESELAMAQSAEGKPILSLKLSCSRLGLQLLQLAPSDASAPAPSAAALVPSPAHAPGRSAAVAATAAAATAAAAAAATAAAAAAPNCLVNAGLEDVQADLELRAQTFMTRASVRSVSVAGHDGAKHVDVVRMVRPSARDDAERETRLSSRASADDAHTSSRLLELRVQARRLSAGTGLGGRREG